MIPQYYGILGVVLNDAVLLEQCGVTIEDHVNRLCRITVESAVPEKGLEVDGRSLLGERVKVAVHLVRPGYVVRGEDLGAPMLELDGTVVAARLEQPHGGEPRAYFTVEATPAPPSEP